ncbi:putative phosphoethanolamine [Phaeomoniella chlamydospora]|uniref:ethanolamine-phosphate cytidylyltransferase n=1 Tax=Phaeomoniella chlamydospora TaxID=158046 RepID=A0A0G2F2Y8_PHACM|nr:putative phosphoethanolamine [Phaeomoniella chlamydospora]
MTHEEIPVKGQWPVDPQEDQPINKDRIWIDGCFDFAHHGHAGAMLQARQLGKELYVGIHSDEAILENKGPTVMTLSERNGEDCYRFVKAAGRFLVVKRTPGISTTDLVGRMLLCTKTHFIKSLTDVLAGKEGSLTEEERRATGTSMLQRVKDYATDASGLQPGCQVWSWQGSEAAKLKPDIDEAGTFNKLVDGDGPRPGQRLIYVDGGFDLFSSGHIEFLKRVLEAEEERGRTTGWYMEDAISKRKAETGEDYSPAYIVAGIHDDNVINHMKGLNYPIMNIFERGLCVLQCKYISSLIFSAPFSPSRSFLTSLPFSSPISGLYHGPTTFVPLPFDPYASAKALGLFYEIGDHTFQDVNAGTIVRRILDGRTAFEERQKRKGEKGMVEDGVKRREALEREALEKEMAARREE